MNFSFEADNRNPRFTLLEGDTDLTMAETYKLCRRYNDELNSQPISPLNNLHVQLNNPFNNLHVQPINPLDNLHVHQPINPLNNLHIQPINPLNDLHISISSALPITHSNSLPSDAVDIHHTILHDQLNPMDHVQRMMREHQREHQRVSNSYILHIYRALIQIKIKAFRPFLSQVDKNLMKQLRCVL